MIKLIIFDLDGVLVEAKAIHFEALNTALENIAGEQAVISLAEHLSSFDGLPTLSKLDKLIDQNRIDKSMVDDIWNEKQLITQQCIKKYIKPEDYLLQQLVLDRLFASGYTLWIASNAIRATIDTMLKYAGYDMFFDNIISNEDVTNPKPHPEIYMRVMLEAGYMPKESLIIEDSSVGRKSASESGGHVLGVKDPHDVNRDNILRAISKADQVNRKKLYKPRWQSQDMNVLIPMAGAGSRFLQAGYTFPKPLIEINGQPMIQEVVENLNIDAKHIFIVQKEHYHKYNLQYVLQLISPSCEIVQVDGVTEGAACTTLLAEELINNDDQLVIANSDQYVDWDSGEFLYACSAGSIDGGILTFKSCHPKWSYAKTDENGFVEQVAEKKPISDNATVGIYYWRTGKDYVKYAQQMIANDIRTNNEFYICPVFNESIKDGGKIKIFPIAADQMWGLGTPEDLQVFLEGHG